MEIQLMILVGLHQAAMLLEFDTVIKMEII